MPPIRPVLGFGRAGWIALVVLAAMIAALALGWDPYMQMLHGWARLFGAESLLWFVVYAVVYPRATVLNAQITFITALVATLAMWIQPRPIARWRLATLWIASPCLAQWYWLSQAASVAPFISWANVRGPVFMYNWMADVIVAVASAALLWWAMRSIAVALAALVAAAIVIPMQIAGTVTGWVPPVNPGALWQLGAGATMVVAAIAERRRAPRSGGPWCGACGYDLQSLAAVRCPECGAEVGVDESASANRSAAAPAEPRP